MILTKLYEYAKSQMKLPPEMYGQVKIRWMVELNADGTLADFTQLGGNTKADKGGDPYVVPDIVRASGIKPKLLADNGEYVFGVGRAASHPEKVAERHRQFKVLVEKCAEATQEPSVQAIAKFLASWQPERDKAKLPFEFDPTNVVTFRVKDANSRDGTIPADARANLQKVQKFWATYTVTGEVEETDKECSIMSCLVTNETGLVEERLPVKLKGIPNGQTAGTSLVSANEPPFTSYGLANSLTSPISREAGEAFAKALNHLIATESSRLYLGSVVYVFWTREESEFNVQSYFKDPEPEDVKRLYQSAQTGKRVEGLSVDEFYALALSASGGRAVVRDWIVTTIPQAEENLRRWFAAQEIVNAYGESNSKPYLSVYRLAESMYRDPQKEMIAAVPTALVRVALKGGKLPNDMLMRAIHRNRVEQDVTYERAALIKLILTTQLKTPERNPMADMQCLNMNPNLDDPVDCTAYHCGRLLAQLEIIQREAQGRDINTTLIDRYYGAASSTPAKVLGSLIQDTQAHLAKIRKDRRGTYEALQGKLEEIIANLLPSNLRPSLTMQQQSLFALGYYHQRAKNRQDAIDAKANKNQ